MEESLKIYASSQLVPTFHWFYHNFTGVTKEDKKDTERKPIVLLYLGVTNITNEIRSSDPPPS